MSTPENTGSYKVITEYLLLSRNSQLSHTVISPNLTIRECNSRISSLYMIQPLVCLSSTSIELFFILREIIINIRFIVDYKGWIPFAATFVLVGGSQKIEGEKHCKSSKTCLLRCRRTKLKTSCLITSNGSWIFWRLLFFYKHFYRWEERRHEEMKFISSPINRCYVDEIYNFRSMSLPILRWIRSMLWRMSLSLPSDVIESAEVVQFFLLRKLSISLHEEKNVQHL